MIYQGTVEIGRPVFLLAAMFGSALTLASFIKVIHSVFLGKKPQKLGAVKSAGWAMSIPMIVLAFFCVVFGVFAQLPLRHLIGPAASVGIDFLKVPDNIWFPLALWNPTLATVLIIVALIVGVIVYLFGTVMNVRKTSMFVGGEKFDNELVRYSGISFYETIREMNPLKVLYKDAEQGIYDLYVLGGTYGKKLIEVLRYIHNGVVSTYLAFVLIGLSFLIFFLVR